MRDTLPCDASVPDAAVPAAAADRPASPAVAPLLLSDREAAALCGLGRSTWRRLLSAGKVLAPLRIGRACRWRRAELLAWLDAGAPDRAAWEATKKIGNRR